MRPVEVVLVTHGVLGKCDGEILAVQGTDDGTPPPTLVMAADNTGRSVVTLHRQERTDRDTGPLWAYVQPA